MLYFIGDRQIFPNKSFKGPNGETYCSQWFTALTDEEKTTLGITEQAVPVAKDGKFYDVLGNPLPVADVKADCISEQKEQAQLFLSPTDWYITRKSELNTDVPESVTTYRAAVRTACAAREAELTAPTEIPALETAYNNLTAWPS